jgi:hypothetical protein
LSNAGGLTLTNLKEVKMGKAKRRGTFKQRKDSAKLYTQEEIMMAEKAVLVTGCTLKEALFHVRKVRQQNDKMMAELGYFRSGMTADGIVRFSKPIFKTACA